MATELMAAVVVDRLVYTSFQVVTRKAFSEGKFAEMADLIDSQPQLVFTASQTVRDDLVGPDETRAKLTYEMGFNNVNSLRRNLDECLDDDLKGEVQRLLSATSADDGDGEQGDRTQLSICYRDYFSLEQAKKNELGHRLSFSAEYVGIEDYSVTIDGADPMMTVDDITLMLGSDSKLVGTLTYGRYLGLDPDGSGNSRIDLSWSYEDVDNTSVRNTRSVAELTYAQRVAGSFLFSGGLSWANRPEFLGEVKDNLSARLGLKYQLFSDKAFGTKAFQPSK